MFQKQRIQKFKLGKGIHKQDLKILIKNPCISELKFHAILSCTPIILRQGNSNSSLIKRIAINSFTLVLTNLNSLKCIFHGYKLLFNPPKSCLLFSKNRIIFEML